VVAVLITPARARCSGGYPRPVPAGDPAAELATEVGRLADRLRQLSESRLRRRYAELGDQSAAEAGHALAQWFADAAARLTDGDPAAGRAVPRLTDLAVGDQVAVTGTDLVAASATAPPTSGPAGAELAAVVAEALERAQRLRRAV